MRLMKLIPLLLLLIVATGGITHAQIIDCDGIGESPLDTIRVPSRLGNIGDTVLVPIYVANDTGIASFSAYLEYEDAIISPVVIATDSLFDSLGNFTGLTQDLYDYVVTGRFLETEIKTDSDGFDYLDTVTNVQVVDETDFIGPTGTGRMKIIGSFTSFLNPEVIVPIGSDIIMYVKFVISNSAVHNDQARIDFYAETIETRDTAFPFDIIRTDCLYSRYSDSTGVVDRRFTTGAGVIRVDSTFQQGDIPVINSFTASPSTITSGSSSTLAWNVTGADSVVINNSVGSFTALTGQTSVSPTATTTYTLTAYNASGSAQAFATVTVGTVSGNNNPVIGAVAGAPFTISQGETVNFSVTATDIDASDIITLSATSLPDNASFNQVVGSGSVTGNFTFTPDFTQSGTFVATFSASDNQGGTSNALSVVINVNEIQNDRLFTTSAEGQRPVGGLQGKEAIYFPINLVTSQTVYGIQFDFFYDPVFFTVDSFVTTGRTDAYVIYDDIGGTPGQIRVVTFGLANEPIVNIPDTTAILYAVMSIDPSAPIGDYPVWFENGWESVDPDPDVPGFELVVDSGIIQVDNPGDVNLDKYINVADLVNVVASIINNYTLSERQFDVADVIINDTVDVFDLVGIVNMVFGVPVTPAPPQIYEDDRATIALAYSDIPAGGNEMVVVNSEVPVDIAAVEMDIQYDPEAVSFGAPKLSADAGNLTLRYQDNKAGNLKVLMYFTNPYDNNIIATGTADLIEIPMLAKNDVEAGNNNQMKITKALMSTSSMAKVEVDGIIDPTPVPTGFSLQQNYPNPFNPTTIIEFSIDASQEVSLDIYNILGQHVSTLLEGRLDAGTHSIEWDATNQNGQRVASGIYLYRLRVDRDVETKKMMFLK